MLKPMMALHAILPFMVAFISDFEVTRHAEVRFRAQDKIASLNARRRD
jgi:hypothetical protein